MNGDESTMNCIPDALDVAVFHATRLGGRRVDDALGAVKMPYGYALIIDGDEHYYHWLNYMGQEGPQHWDRWTVYRMAKLNSSHQLAPTHGPLIVPAENA
jgi:predicted N-acetyltransferase YhbS